MSKNNAVNALRAVGKSIYTRTQENVTMLTTMCAAYPNVYKHLKIASTKYDNSLYHNSLLHFQTMRTCYNISQYLFTTQDNALIDLEDDDFAATNQGKFFFRQEPTEPGGSSALVATDEQHLVKADTICFSGIEGDNPRQLSALLRTAKYLSSALSEDYLPIALCPEVDREERYEAAKTYSINPDYYPQYIKSRVDQVIIPRLLPYLSDSSIPEVVQPLSILTFSMGGREAMMIETALYDLLSNDYGMGDKEVSSTLQQVTAVCLGYAPDVRVFDSGCMNKIIIFSVNDRGVLIPHNLFLEVLTHNSVLDAKVTEVVFDTDEGIIQRLVICNQEKVVYQKDYLDHTLGDYLECTRMFDEEMLELIGGSLVPPTNESVLDSVE